MQGRTSPLARRTWLGVGVASALCASTFAVWLARTDSTVLRETLKGVQFWSLQLLTLVFAIATAAAAPILARMARRYHLPVGGIAAASALAFVLIALVAPRTNRIYFDEHIYQHIGQNMADLGLTQMCNDGSFGKGSLVCVDGEYNKQPAGYPQLLSVIYRLAGVRESFAFWLNALCAALLVIVVGFATSVLFEDGRAGAFAALVMALVPEQLRWSNTAAVEPSAALFCAIALLAAIVFARERSTAALSWLAASAAMAVQFRPESLLCLPLIGLIVWRLAPDELQQPRLWLATLAGLVLCGALVAHLVAVRDDTWGASGPRFAWQYVSGNLAVNGPFYLADRRFPAVYSGLALAGVLFARRSRGRTIVMAYFLLFWGLFLFFYAGSYDYGADVRYSLLTYPPLAMLAGTGLSGLAGRIAARMASPAAAAGVLAALVLLQFVPYVPNVRSIGDEAWGARADVEAARAFRRSLPGDAIVLTHTPSLFLLWGTNALQTSIATTEPDRIERLRLQSRPVFLHWGFWCNIDDEVQRSFCTTALARFPGEIVSERDNRSYHFKLYRLF